MWSFRAYLNKKCADPGFLDQYREQCAICPKTVLVFNEIRNWGLNEAVARARGVEPNTCCCLNQRTDVRTMT
jgi:hypothetical protein